MRWQLEEGCQARHCDGVTEFRRHPQLISLLNKDRKLKTANIT